MDRVKMLEDTMRSSSFGQYGSRSMQTMLARMERLEQIVRAENSIEAMAQVSLGPSPWSTCQDGEKGRHQLLNGVFGDERFRC